VSLKLLINGETRTGVWTVHLETTPIRARPLFLSIDEASLSLRDRGKIDQSPSLHVHEVANQGQKSVYVLELMTGAEGGI
jgi:hypothetical protein